MDPHQSSPDSNAPARKQDSVWLGLGLTVVLHFLQLLLLIPSLALDKPWILFFGFTQLFYIAPAIFYFLKRDQDKTVRGLIIGASITFVLGFPFAGLAIICGSFN